MGRNRLRMTLCQSRMVRECAFGRLKARFGCLSIAIDINWNELPYVIYACFVLHNFCKVKKENIRENKVSTSIAFDKHFQPSLNTKQFHNRQQRGRGKKSQEGPNSVF